MGFLHGSVVKNLPANLGATSDMFDPWARKISWRGKWQPILVFLLGNPQNRGAWWAIVHRIAKEPDTT